MYRLRSDLDGFALDDRSVSSLPRARSPFFLSDRDSRRFVCRFNRWLIGRNAFFCCWFLFETATMRVATTECWLPRPFFFRASECFTGFIRLSEQCRNGWRFPNRIATSVPLSKLTFGQRTWAQWRNDAVFIAKIADSHRWTITEARSLQIKPISRFLDRFIHSVNWKKTNSGNSEKRNEVNLLRTFQARWNAKKTAKSSWTTWVWKYKEKTVRSRILQEIGC